MAFTSAFRGPSDRGKRLLKAAITDPSWLRTTTPFPTALVFEKTTASVFTMYFRKSGGIQCASAASLCCGLRSCASLKSSSMDWGLWIISLQDCCGAPIRVLFLLKHMHQTVVIVNSSKSIPTCWIRIGCQIKSIDSLYCMPLRSIGKPVTSQVSRVDVCGFLLWTVPRPNGLWGF